MTTPTRDEIRSGIKRLSGLSPAVQAILPRLGDEALGAQELGSMISQDPILAARVLHLANSPFYGLSRQVGSLEEAVLILGISHLRGMVLSAGLIRLFADTEAIAQSLGTAAAAGSLAKLLKQDQGKPLLQACCTTWGLCCWGILIRKPGNPWRMSRRMWERIVCSKNLIALDLIIASLARI